MTDQNEVPSFARGAPRDAELRGMIPRSLADLIDAAMIADGQESRMDVVIPLLWEALQKRLHAATVLCRVARVNPFESDADGTAPERLAK